MKGIQYRFKMLVALSLLMVCFAPMGFAPKRVFAADAAQQELKVLRSMVEALALSVAAASEDNAALRREVAELRREVAELRSAAPRSGERASVSAVPSRPAPEGGDEDDAAMKGIFRSFMKQVLEYAAKELDLDGAEQDKGVPQKR